jgi:hypothetical protein
MFSWLVGRFSKYGVVVLAGYIFWLGWVNFGPRKPELGAERRDAAQKAVESVVEQIRLNRGNVRDVILVYFKNDQTDKFTDMLRDVIEKNGVLVLRDRTVAQKVFGRLNLTQWNCPSDDVAAAIAKKRKADAVLYGTMADFESYKGGVNISLGFKLVSPDGKVVYDGTYQSIEKPGVPAKISKTDASFDLGTFLSAFSGWVLLILLLPVFTFVFVRSTVAKRSNASNATALIIYTLADGILAWLFIGRFFGGWMWAVFGGIVFAAFIYNVQIMSFAAKLED